MLTKKGLGGTVTLLPIFIALWWYLSVDAEWYDWDVGLGFMVGMIFINEILVFNYIKIVFSKSNFSIFGKTLWALAIFFFGPVSMPLYWLLYFGRNTNTHRPLNLI